MEINENGREEWRSCSSFLDRKMESNYTAIDIETTGLNPKTEKIIEMGAVRVREGKIVDRYERLVCPGRKLEERITSLTGISDEMLKNAPPPEEVLPELLAFIGEDILLGHHLIFDYSFIKRAAVNLRLLDEKSNGMGIDTLKIARHFLMDLESRSLESLCRYFKISHKAHRAINDAEATVLLYQKLSGEFREGSVFEPQPLIYRVKRETPATKAQKERLYKLTEKHKILLDYDINTLTKNEASRLADKIILKYGKG
ncbi:MAG: PolC-type DNA polymerase III [Suilimivivens sp.]